jgi:hypothetical protein
MEAPPPFGPSGPPWAFDAGPGFGGPGFGGPGGPMREELQLVSRFDKDGNGWLDRAERQAARQFLRQSGGARRFGGPGGRPGRFGLRVESQQRPSPGPKVSPAEAQAFPDAPLYATNVLRTFFLDFDGPDWEQELEDFHNTDVEVPAKLTVDGKTYVDVGVHFRGASSYMMLGTGMKRSLNLSLDFIHQNQNLGGYRTLNLLNSAGDPTFMRTVLCFDIARAIGLPAPKANWVRLVINGESWGLYVNVQQINKDFIQEWFGTRKGARWKVPGSPHGRGGLTYLGDDPAPYKRIYQIKSKDEPSAWAALIKLCKVLNQTPPDQLEAALAPLLDIDEALKFLALENALVNTDGYWTRASDYYLYLDEQGRFHLIPYDVNETFGGAGGPAGLGGPDGPPRMRGPGRASGLDDAPGFAGPPGLAGPGAGRRFRAGPGSPGGGPRLDPLAGANDPDKPLLSKLLAVPQLRARYLAYIRQIAEQWLDWSKLGPIVAQYRALIADEVRADPRKLSSFEAFQQGVADRPATDTLALGRGTSLRSFAEQRRAFLLNHPEVQKAAH